MNFIIPVFNKVKLLLQENQKYRDDDKVLAVRYWKDELRVLKHDPKQITALDFFILLMNEKVTAFNLITRGRRACNSKPEFSSLVGKSYHAKRKKTSAKKPDSTFGKVKELLESDKKYRDNDRVLVVRFWWNELRQMKLDGKKISAEKFFNLFIKGLFSSDDLICRSRRKVNEIHPDTIGLSYKPRQQKESRIKHELKKIREKVK